MTLDELLEKLRELEKPSRVLGSIEYFPVISREGFKDVEMLIRQYALDNHDKELGVLQAKVYAYEQIIANSNFAPMIIKESEDKVCKGCHYNDGEVHAECVVCDKADKSGLEYADQDTMMSAT